MINLQIGVPKRNWIWIQLAWLNLFFTFGYLIYKGPELTFLFIKLGFILTFIGAFFSLFKRTFFPTLTHSFVLFLTYFVVLILTIGLEFFFLKPISREKQKIPPLTHVYKDPFNVFQIKGPVDWKYELISTPREVGVTISPEGNDGYSGVSEIKIYIRPLDIEPEKIEPFLERAAISFSKKENPSTSSSDISFTFQTEPATLINNEKAVWSILNVKKFWVTIRQVTLLGIKNKKYLCSVSATGLESHSLLSKVFCLGLFQTLTIQDESFFEKSIQTNGFSG